MTSTPPKVFATSGLGQVCLDPLALLDVWPIKSLERKCGIAMTDATVIGRQLDDRVHHMPTPTGAFIALDQLVNALHRPPITLG